MGQRKHIPSNTEFKVFWASGRRCCICFALDHAYSVKQGQIAHLDHDPSNYNLDNLAWLCIPHHDQYDTKTRQSKGFTMSEVKHYRKTLAGEVHRRRQLATEGKSVDKTRLIQENLALFLFAAHAMYKPEFRTLLRKEVTDPDFLTQVEDAWAFLDSPVSETERLLGNGPTRLDRMASYVALTDEGKEDFKILLDLAGAAVNAMDEKNRLQTLCGLHDDTIRSGLLLLHKISKERKQEMMKQLSQPII